MKVLELFSGIGGMHYALKESGIEAEVTAIEINPIANHVYRHNFPKTNLLQRNIQSITAKEINSLDPEMILMSPPCQPFTRVGLKKDISDERSCALRSIISILPAVNATLRYILVENVKGFEVSIAREKLIECLDTLGFDYQELMLSPIQIGVPNVRLRYYLIAKRTPTKLCFPYRTTIMETMPNQVLDKETDFQQIRTIGEFLHEDSTQIYDEYLVSNKVLSKHSSILDIATTDSKKTCCFTKAYGHYVEGTGSVFCPFNEEKIKELYELFKISSDLEVLRRLKLRYFTAEEIAKLMCFPLEFSFPSDVSLKQKYRLLGNSINVKVVALLLRILMSD